MEGARKEGRGKEREIGKSRGKRKERKMERRKAEKK